MAYCPPGMFEWDEAKSAANLRARGFDFAFAARIFDGPTLELDDVSLMTSGPITASVGFRRSGGPGGLCCL